jgi:hypothetical protein
MHTDHNNLTFTSAVNDHVIWQLNYIERFGPKYLHITGDDNFLANMFSHLSRLSNANVPVAPIQANKNTTNGITHVTPTENVSFLLDDIEMFNWFLNLPNKDNLPLSLDLCCIAAGQHTNQDLWQSCLAHPLIYPEWVWWHLSAHLSPPSQFSMENLHPVTAAPWLNQMVPPSS